MQLYYLNSGQLSLDVFGPQPPQLGNLFSGEQQVESAFLSIRVQREMGRSYPMGTTLRLRVIEKTKQRLNSKQTQRVVIDKSQRLSGDPQFGYSNFGFWLHDVGCSPLQIDVELFGQHPLTGRLGSLQKQSRTVGFVCSE
jgi:hypothetical protein